MQIKQKIAKRLSKIDQKGKSEMITSIVGEFEPLTEEVLNKIDPSVIYAFQTAVDNGITRKDVVETMNNYIYSLGGSSNAQAEIRGLITYNRRGMDYWKPSTFISKIINHRYYKTMAKYIKSAKEFVDVIPDITIKQYLESKKVKLLAMATEQSNRANLKANEVKENAKDYLGDTAAKAKATGSIAKETGKDLGKTFVKAGQDIRKTFAETLKYTGEKISDANEKINKENDRIDSIGVPKIPKGEDKRTPGQKAADETAMRGDNEER